eukprot:m.348600 g.348600  ORF g.348600 m.348600 type:complete len:66 (-) comp20677_c0_seq2:1474-1671(-)
MSSAKIQLLILPLTVSYRALVSRNLTKCNLDNVAKFTEVNNLLPNGGMQISGEDVSENMFIGTTK